MNTPIDIETFAKFVEAYVPFAWDTNEDNFQEDIRGKHSALINFMRYWHVVRYVQSHCREDRLRTVMDIGPFPGSMIKILRTFFGQDLEYIGIGLGFSEDYAAEMAKLGGKLFATELDPEFVEPQMVRDWPFADVDCCLFLDAIEHLVNPVDCLDRINNSLKMGGKLVITTDNIAALGYILHMFRCGGSPNIPAARSHLFYHGDWRPHFREYSREELLFFVEHCGFKLIKHEYFERKQGDYYLDQQGAIYCKNRYRGIKGLVRRLLLRYLPHVRDHQILIAEKVVEFKEKSRNRPAPTHDMKEWLRIRQSLGY